jgi:hypothetical protein
MLMELKPQDLPVLFKRVANPERSWTYANLVEILGLSAYQVHRSVQRATEADPVADGSVYEVLSHGTLEL